VIDGQEGGGGIVVHAGHGHKIPIIEIHSTTWPSSRRSRANTVVRYV
jgi:hypothetical protein